MYRIKNNCYFILDYILILLKKVFNNEIKYFSYEINVSLDVNHRS